METSYYIKPESKITSRFVLLSFVTGAIVGSIGDFMHVLTHTDFYLPDGIFPSISLLPVTMPVWVPFLFGSAVALMACFHKLLSRLFHPRMERHAALATFAPMIFLLLYALTGLIQAGTGGWQDIWVASVAILLWWYADRTLTGALMALFVALCGTFFEIFLVSIGAFYYYPAHANLLGVPSWLPWLYAAASVCVSLFARHLTPDRQL